MAEQREQRTQPALMKAEQEKRYVLRPLFLQSDLHGVVAVLLLQVLQFGLSQGPRLVKHKLGLPDISSSTPSLEVTGLLVAGLWYLLVLSSENTVWYTMHRTEIITLGHWFFTVLNALSVGRAPAATWTNTIFRCSVPAFQASMAFSSSLTTLLVRIVGCVLLFAGALVVLGAGTAAVPIFLVATAAAGVVAAQWKLDGSCSLQAANIKSKGDQALVATRTGREAESTESSGALDQGASSPTSDRRPGAFCLGPVIPARQNSLVQRTGPSLSEAIEAAARAVRAVEEAAMHVNETPTVAAGQGGSRPRSENADPQRAGGAVALQQAQQRAGGAVALQQAQQRAGGAVALQQAQRRRVIDGSELVLLARAPAPARVVPGVPVARDVEQSLGASASGISFNIGAEVARLTSLCKVMEIEEAEAYILQAKHAMERLAEAPLDSAPRPPDREDAPAERTRAEAPPDQGELASTSQVPASSGQLRAGFRVQIGRREVRVGGQMERVLARARERSSQARAHLVKEAAGCPSLLSGLLQQAKTTVSALGYDMAVRKWQESRVEARGLESLHGALRRSGPAGERDLVMAVNGLRDARLGFLALGIAAAGREPWKALRRRAPRRVLLMGPLWTSEHWSMAEDKGRTAWLAATVPTDALIQGTAAKVFPPLGPQQGMAVSAVARDMDKVEEVLSEQFEELVQKMHQWLVEGGQIQASSCEGQAIGSFGEEVERIVLKADEELVQLFQRMRELMTPLQMATLLLLMMEHRAGVEKLGSFWDGCARGDDVLTGVRKMLGTSEESDDDE